MTVSIYRPLKRELRQQRDLKLGLKKDYHAQADETNLPTKVVKVKKCTGCMATFESPRQVTIIIGKLCKVLCDRCESKSKPFCGEKKLDSLRTGDSTENDCFVVRAMLRRNRGGNYGAYSSRYSSINGQLARANG